MNVIRLLKWMRERGWPVVLYCRPGTNIHDAAEDERLMYRLIDSDFKYGDIPNARKLAGYLKQDNVRVVSLHQSHDMLLGVLAKKFTRGFTKVIYSQHMHIGANKKDLFHRWEYRQFDAWITPVNWLAERVMEKTVVPKDKIHIITRGIELDRYLHNRPSREDARKQLNLPLDLPIVGIIGRLDPLKGQHVVINAATRVHLDGHKLHVAVIGAKTHGEETGYEQELRNLVMEAGLQDYVHFRPHQKRAEFAYAALDIFVLATKSETYGMVVIEAMATGLPVIATRDGGVMDLIDDEHNGLLYTPMDDAELAKCLLRYLQNPTFATRMAIQAEQDALNKYSHEKQCEGWERVIDSLVK